MTATATDFQEYGNVCPTFGDVDMEFVRHNARVSLEAMSKSHLLASVRYVSGIRAEGLSFDYHGWYLCESPDALYQDRPFLFPQSASPEES